MAFKQFVLKNAVRSQSSPSSPLSSSYSSFVTVEDALEVFLDLIINAEIDLFNTLFPDDWHSRFVSNVFGYVSQRKPLSSEQAKIVLKMVARAKTALVEKEIVEEKKIDQLLANPKYRLAPYQSSSIPREVRYVGDNMLAFRFKMNDVIVDSIKSLRKKSDNFTHDVIRFDHLARVWLVRVTRDTIDPIMQIIGKNRFQIDDATIEYLTLATNSRGQPSTFVFDPESGKIVANICDNEIIASWVRYVLGAEVL